MARTIDSFLSTTPSLRLAAQQAKRSAALGKALASLLPPALASACIPIATENGAVIYAENGAVAAKLRQMLPTLTAKLRNRAFEVTGISVEVQARPKPPKPLIRHLSPAAAQSLKALSGELPPSPLKAALERLARRQKE